MSGLGWANEEKAVNDFTITDQVLPTVAAHAKYGLDGDAHPFHIIQVMIFKDPPTLGLDNWDNSASTQSPSSFTYLLRPYAYAHASRDRLQASVASPPSKALASQRTSQTSKSSPRSASYLSKLSEVPSHHGVPIEPLQRK